MRLKDYRKEARMPEKPVSGISVRINGNALTAEYSDRILEVTVRHSLRKPDSCVVRISDPQGKEVESNPFQLGREIDVLAGARTDNGTYTTIFKGQITAVQPEFGQQGCVVGIQAYDKAIALYQDVRTKTFQNQTATDIVESVLKKYDLRVGTMDPTGLVYDFMQQASKTDAEFIWSLARKHDFEFLVSGNVAHFRKAGTTKDRPVELKWQEKLRSFKPRVSGMQQPQQVTVRHLNPETNQVIEATATAGELSSTPGIGRSEVTKAAGGGTVVVSDRVVFSESEAQALAKSTMRKIAESYVEAEGVAEGNPRIIAGTHLDIQNVGQKFSGKYVVTDTVHSYRSGRDYETYFEINGRESRSISDILGSNGKRTDWGNFLVIGVVTNNQDPASLGRIRVKYPSLGEETESWWARVATVGGGKERGMLMLPVPGDEVIVGFELGDTRKPYIVGSLYNGKAEPGEELNLVDGSFGLKSDKKVLVASKENLTLRSDQKLIITVTGEVEETIKKTVTSSAEGDVSLESKKTFTVKGQSVTISGEGSISVKASGALSLEGATVDIKANTEVNISGQMINLG
jgi:phage protein D